MKHSTILALAQLDAQRKTKPRKRAPRPRPAPLPIDDISLPAGPRIVVPFPPVACNPNRRDHWGKIRAAKAYRRECWALALAAGIKLPRTGNLIFRLDFFPPDLARRDDDNAIASFKAGRDGIAEALKIDDSRFRTLPVWHSEPRACVVVTILKGEGA
jgi:crossover junction endodeoxyribonuclease RusA